MTLFYQRFFSLVILVLFLNVKHWWLVMVSWHFIIRASSSVTMVQFWLVIAWERKGFDSSKNNCVCFIISLKKYKLLRDKSCANWVKCFGRLKVFFQFTFSFLFSTKRLLVSQDTYGRIIYVVQSDFQTKCVFALNKKLTVNWNFHMIRP